MFQFEGLSKKAFDRENRDQILALLDQANNWAEHHFDGPTQRVSLLDFQVLLNTEAGLSGGTVDPNYEHSLGEIGLFPLPDNIDFWLDEAGPAWDGPMDIEVNIDAFLRYAASLKNRFVGMGGPFEVYRGLFRQDGIVGFPVREAKLLAGVVHGYFTTSTYSDRKPPYEYLLNSYVAEIPLSEMMEPTRYSHAGTSILTNRQRNLEDALLWG